MSNSTTSSSSTTSSNGAEESSMVYQKMFHGIEMATRALEDVRKRVKEYDEKYIGVGSKAEKASVYLAGTFEKIGDSIGDLGRVVDSLKQGPNLEFPIRAMARAVAAVHGAYTQLVEKAHQYDETFKLSESIFTAVTYPKEQAISALTSVATYAANVAELLNAQLHGISDALRVQLVTVASSQLERALPTAVKADEMFHLSENASHGAALVLSTAKDLNSKFGFSSYWGMATNQAQFLDSKITGGRITPTISTAYSTGWNMITSVQAKYEEKKKEIGSKKSK